MIDSSFVALFISVGALGMALRIIATFKGDELRFRPQLSKIIHLLETLLERAETYRFKIEELLVVTEPLQEQEEQLRKYCELLTQLDLDKKREEEKLRQDKEGKGIKSATHA